MKLLTILLGVVIVVGGSAATYFFVIKSKPKPKPVEDVVVEVVDADQVLDGAMFDLGPFVINLASPGAYLRLNVTLELFEFEILEGSEAQKSIFRDVIISRLSAERVSNLVNPRYKTTLLKELVPLLNEKAKEEFEVVDVFFTEFVVQ